MFIITYTTVHYEEAKDDTKINQKQLFFDREIFFSEQEASDIWKAIIFYLFARFKFFSINARL